MVDIPLQGTPGVLDTRNPTLLPNTDQGVASGGVISLMSPADFVASNPRTAATVTATVAGSITNGDSVVMTLTHPLLTGGSLAKTINIVTADNVDTIVEKIAKAFNDDAQCQSLNIFVDGVAGVATFNWPGPVGNSGVLTRTLSGGATETVTIANSGKLASGDGPIVPTQNFQYQFGGSVVNFRYGEPVFADFPLLTALLTDGMPIT